MKKVVIAFALVIAGIVLLDLLIGVWDGYSTARANTAELRAHYASDHDGTDVNQYCVQQYGGDPVMMRSCKLQGLHGKLVFDEASANGADFGMLAACFHAAKTVYGEDWYLAGTCAVQH